MRCLFAVNRTSLKAIVKLMSTLNKSFTLQDGTHLNGLRQEFIDAIRRLMVDARVSFLKRSFELLGHFVLEMFERERQHRRNLSSNTFSKHLQCNTLKTFKKPTYKVLKKIFCDKFLKLQSRLIEKIKIERTKS